ncbi:MAG: hypothetical protein HYS18_16835 [Burkholderiales bacterium]|nr:hypothetical protein [Burkholderiales bacterium]
MKFQKSILAAAVLMACAASASAADNFKVVATNVTNNQTATFGFSTALTTLDSLQAQYLQTKLPSYTGNEVARFNMDYRGLAINLAFNTLNSSTLDFSIPVLGINQQFTGSTRNASQSLLVDYMKTGDLLGLIQKKLAEVSPIDPIAGNPNSMMSQMVANDFNNAFLATASNIAPPPQTATAGEKADSSSNNLIGIGLRFGQYKQGDLNSQSVTIPFSYTIRSDIDPRRQLIFNVPVTYTTVEGAKAYFVGAGAAYRIPMNDHWTLTPAFNYGLTGAPDLGSAAQVMSGSLSSTYILNMSGFDLAIGNMIGYYKTLKFSTSGYSYDPGIQNTVFRNGIMLSQPINFMGRKMSIEYSLVDTRFTGTALYNKGYDEIGITIGTNKSAQSARSYLRAGANFLVSPQSKGFSLNLGYWF